MNFEERWYQLECANASVEDILSKQEFDPVSVMPTGSGKSVVICLTSDEFLSERPRKKILVLSHVDKILDQNYRKLCEYFDQDFVGLYSAGLGRKELNKITVAGIHSVYKKPELFNDIGLIVIDECHLVNSVSDSEGMYRKFIKELKNNSQDRIPVWGLTATPFRTGQGYIYKQYKDYNPLFNKLSYDLSSYENYNRLIDEGYLVPLIPAPVDYVMDVDGIPKSAGDFVIDALVDRFNREEITQKIVLNTIKYAKNKYKKWLFFAIDKLHALAIKHELEKNGVKAECVYSGMAKNQDEVLRQYKAGEIKAVVNVNMLVTGVDIPEIDLIADCRPTDSVIVHSQGKGRGARPAPWIGKTHCLCLDYAGNTQRHGPVNDLKIYEPGSFKKTTGKDAPTKTCPNCKSLNSTRAVFCIACDEEFKIDTKLSAVPTMDDIVKKDDSKKQSLTQWLKVKSVRYSIHQKTGAPSSLRVQYECGFNTFSEWICIDHDMEWLQRRAHKWVSDRWTGQKFMQPENLNELYENRFLLKKPTEIYVSLASKFPEVLNYKFHTDDVQNSVPFPTPKPNSNFGKSLIVEDDDIPF